ncbi:acid phosphatase [Cadophora sp. DSE1049]|nr:acid phosphatase [Cadophora sp. DSE1049]
MAFGTSHSLWSYLALSCAFPTIFATPFSRDRNELRLNQVQVIGTHNSYHIEPTLAERPLIESVVSLTTAQDLYYSHATISDQLTFQSMRGLEFDLFADSKGGLYTSPLARNLSNLPFPDVPALALPGTKVLHIADVDVSSRCFTFVDCLTQVRTWSKANKGHTLIPIMLEFNTQDPAIAALGGTPGEPWNITNIPTVDIEIRSVFSDDELITPDDIRRPGLTLEQSVLQNGWPTQRSAKNKVMFLMDNDPVPGIIRNPYRANGHENLEGRAIFTNSVPGESDGAFLKRNDPTGDNLKLIQDLVKKGYFVRTRSDVPIRTVLENSFVMRDAALASGAQLISTDFPTVGMAARYNSTFVARLEDGKMVRCNPVIGGRRCRDEKLERLEKRKSDL